MHRSIVGVNMTNKEQKNILGDAVKLIDDARYYEHYINRKQTFPYLWELSIKIALKQKNPSHYFASQWSNNNLYRTVDRLTELSAIGILKIMSNGVRVPDSQLSKFVHHMPTHFVENHTIYYKTPNRILIKMLPPELYQKLGTRGTIF